MPWEAHCEFVEAHFEFVDFPVIDFALLPWKSAGDHDQRELEKLRGACQELGFFPAINHGVNPTLIQAMDSMARDMFMLPADIKERAIYPIFNTGYAPPKTGPQGKDSLPESIVFPNDSSVGDISSKLWPHGNHKFRETMQEYNSEMREVSHGILKVILCSLGLDISEHYSSPLFDKSQGWLRVNFYIHRFSIKMPTPSMRNIPKRGQVKAAIASSLAHSVRSLLRPSKSFNYSAASSSSSRATADLLRAQ